MCFPSIWIILTIYIDNALEIFFFLFSLSLLINYFAISIIYLFDSIFNIVGGLGLLLYIYRASEIVPYSDDIGWLEKHMRSFSSVYPGKRN